MKCILIKLEDSEYYDDKYNFPSFIVEYEENIEEKLEKVCKNYDDFNEVEDFIKNNFKNIEYLQYTIEI